MSFKKTSEGRVYFEGSKKTANDWPESDKPSTRKPIKVSAAPASEGTNLQIVSLLRALNEKLQITQAERREMRREIESYRAIVENLQSQSGEESAARAIHAEEVAQEALRELEEARKLILQIETKAERADKGVSTLKTQLVKSVQKLDGIDQKQTEFEQKLADSEVNQAKMLRQVDKAVEERARFMRKIERIEEAVLQTQEALNARAMVLLTDQNARAQTVEAIQDGLLPPRKEPLADDLASQVWWKRPWENSGVIVALLLVTALAGLGLTELQKNPNRLDFSNIKLAEKILPPEATQQAIPETQTTQGTEPQDDQLTSLSSMTPAPSETEKQNLQNFYNALNTAEETAPTPTQTQPAPLTPVQNIEPAASDDVGTIDLNDDQKLLDALEKNPDAVAAELNKLEPSIPAPSEDAIAYNTPQETTPAPAVIKMPPAGPKFSPDELAAKIKPDSSLPASLKDIQDQAYAGVPEAQHDLAAIYVARHGGVDKDYKRAAFWFEQAAAQDIPNAAYNLGVLYHQGLGVEKNLTRAIEWYQDAASLGHPEAQYNLGIAYIEGIGVPYNAEIAARNFRNAANQGITEAAYNLGLIYENGLLGEAKPDEALMWYKTAADAGSPEAKQALQQLAKTLGISLDEVNRIADSMKTIKKSEAPNESSAKFAKYSGQEQVLTAQVQDYLATAGLYDGPANGFASDKTEEAVRTYQTANNLVADGKITKNLLSHMLASGTEYGSRE